MRRWRLPSLRSQLLLRHVLAVWRWFAMVDGPDVVIRHKRKDILAMLTQEGHE